LLWNIEGRKTMMEKSPEMDLFEDATLVLLVETFDTTKMTDYRGYYNFCSPAIQGEAGRPSGGIDLLIKPILEPTLIRTTENSVICQTKIGRVHGYYFNPLYSIEDIIETISSDLQSIDESAIVLGDFNCRTDNDCARGKILTDAMSNLGFSLINDPSTPTYVAKNGKSCIDLVFCNIKRKQVKKHFIKPPPQRKHALVISYLRFPGVKTKQVKRLGAIRVIDENKFLEAVSGLSLSGKISEVDIVNETIARCAPKYKRPKYKPWFNDECMKMKMDVLASFGYDDYLPKQKQYKEMLKAVKTKYDEEQLIEKLKNSVTQPWLLFGKQRSFLNTITKFQWQDHFTSLLASESSPPVIDNDPDQESLNWYNDSLTLEELEKVVCATKFQKAPGIDRVTNEALRACHPILAMWWFNLMNSIFDQAQIPEVWKFSRIKTLFKGKGGLEDPNSYRGIALLPVGFKFLTKVLHNKIVPEVDHLLPDQQHGFRRGRSCESAISIFVRDVEGNISCGVPIYAVFVDFAKAFDSLDRGLLCDKLYNLGVKGKLYNLIRAILKCNFVVVDNRVSLNILRVNCKSSSSCDFNRSPGCLFPMQVL